MDAMETEAINNGFEQSSDESDTAEVDEINSIFSSCEHIHCQSLGPKYILHISATSESDPYIAAALSDYSCDIFSLKANRLSKIAQFKEHTNKLVGCKFSPRNNNLLYSAASDGTVKLWDLRIPAESALTFADTSSEGSGSTKSLSSFDVSSCDRLLAAGTDLFEGDAYILFWDVRNAKLLGAYWESHTDDITQIKFHPDDTNKLISGSTDGLINVYNLFEPSEEDALQECLNTEAFVEDLHWFNENSRWKICCTTSTNDLQLWETDGAEPYKRFLRDAIAKQIRKKTDNTYLDKIHLIRSSLLVLSGSNGHEGQSLRSVQISNGELRTAYQFKENTQRVRASWVNEHAGLLLTGGEKGKLDIWKPDFSIIKFKASKKK